MVTSAGEPNFVRADSWLLAAIVEGSADTPSGMSKKLQEFVHDCDWLNRSIPSFHEVSYGLQRLAAAGYVTFEREPGHVLRLKATSKALKVAASVHRPARTLGDVLTGFTGRLGCRPYPSPEVEDRSLGPLAGFEQEEWDAAVKAYRQWFDDTAKWLIGTDLSREPE